MSQPRDESREQPTCLPQVLLDQSRVLNIIIRDRPPSPRPAPNLIYRNVSRRDIGDDKA
jgi:hypothetical protein